MKDARDLQPPLYPDVAPLDGSSSQDTHGNLGRFGCRNSRGVFFLPQRPYMVLGTLRQQLLYPMWTEDLVSISDNNKPAGTKFRTVTRLTTSPFSVETI